MKKVLFAVLALMPFVASAQTRFSNLESFITGIGRLVNIALPVVVGIALLVFFWGIVQYFFAGGKDSEAHKKGRDHMIWGIVGLFVMVSVWGLVKFIGQSLGVGAGSNDNPSSATVPTVQFRGQ